MTDQIAGISAGTFCPSWFTKCLVFSAGVGKATGPTEKPSCSDVCCGRWIFSHFFHCAAVACVVW